VPRARAKQRDEREAAGIALRGGRHDPQSEVLKQISIRGVEDHTKLTPREHEVLLLVAGGQSAPDIAESLCVETSTVKTHLQNLYEKLGVSERAAAVAEGMRRGLVE